MLDMSKAIFVNASKDDMLNTAADIAREVGSGAVFERILSATVRETAAACQRLTSERDRLAFELKEAKDHMGRLTHQLAAMTARCAEVESRLVASEETLSSLANRHNDLVRECNKLVSVNATLTDQLKAMTARAHKAEAGLFAKAFVQETSDAIKPGDVVKLKSGGPHMTVLGVDDDDADCTWSIGIGTAHAFCPLASLVKVEPQKIPNP